MSLEVGISEGFSEDGLNKVYFFGMDEVLDFK